MSDQAPFIPSTPDEEPIPPKPWQVFRAPGFPQLFAAQVVSSTGDWIGFFAILALAGNISNNAVGLVMVARMLPGFLLAPVGGALVDRWNRKAVMVSADLGRAGLLAVLPFWHGLLGLVVISFSVEVLTLLWGPAKDATVPNVVKDPDQLASANSLGLVAAFGTFPLGSVIFAVLAAVSAWVGGFQELSRFRVEQVSLAFWVDGLTFVASAILISRLRLAQNGAKPGTPRPPARQTWSEIVDGLKFIRANPLVRGVMIGLAGGLIGGGSIVPLGAVFAKEVLGATPSAFGFLTTAFGMGAALGVVTLLALQRRLPRRALFTSAVIATGVAIMLVACVSMLSFAILLVGVVGAGAGCAYVTGFTLLQESVVDEMRGRMFATLYTLVRFCLLLSLTVGPFVAAALGVLSRSVTNGELKIGSAHLGLPGVRLALWLGGAVTVLAGVMARRRMQRVQAIEVNPA
ncbi:MAG TPA: MFS transporter [Acidimicrobiia bacterium]|nr:MFS transporter [Acidimicrobiia bacterium]